MKNKDLAEEYLNKVADSAIYFKKGKFPDMPLFQEKDIKDAFNAGCKSVLKNMPKLDWETLKDGSLRASTPFGCYNIDKNEYGFNDYIISSISGETKTVFGKQNAILVANEDYRERLIQALGL